MDSYTKLKEAAWKNRMSEDWYPKRSYFLKNHLSERHVGTRKFNQSSRFRKMRLDVLTLYGMTIGNHVHHIDNDKNNNELYNLIALSPSHHRTIHSRQKDEYKATLDRAIFYSITEYWHE